jgi:cobalamin synthase
MVLTIFISSKKGHIGLANRFQKQIKESHFILSSILPFLLIIYLFDTPGLIIFVGVSLFALIAYASLLKEFGRITGDHFGFINELIEVTVLLIFLMA